MPDSDKQHLPRNYKLDVYTGFEREYPTLYNDEEGPSFSFFRVLEKALSKHKGEEGDEVQKVQ